MIELIYQHKNYFSRTFLNLVLTLSLLRFRIDAVYLII